MTRIRSLHWAILCLAGFLAACGSGKTNPPDQKKKPDEEPPITDGPTWEGREIVSLESWTTLGDVVAWGRGRLGPEGKPGFVFGGNGIGAVSEEGELLWMMLGEDGAPLDPMVLDLQVVRLGEGSDHVLATTVGDDAFLLDGRDGSLIWHRKLDYFDERRAELHLLGGEEEPLFFSEFGKAIHYARTGEVAWRHALDEPPIYAHSLPSADRDAPLVVLAIDRGWNRGDEEPDIFVFTADGSALFEVSSERFVTRLASLPAGEAGSHHLIVGTNEGRLLAFDQEGTRLWVRELPFDAPNRWNVYVDRIFVPGFEAVDAPEIVLSLRLAFAEGTTLVGLDRDGSVRWSEKQKRPVTFIEKLESASGPELVVAWGGFPTSSDLSTFRAHTGEAIRNLLGVRGLTMLARGEDGGEVVAGLAEGRLAWIRPGGEAEFGPYVGSSILHASPLPQGGILALDAWGLVSVLHEPRARWSAHFNPREGESAIGESHFFEHEGKTLLAVSGIDIEEPDGPSAIHFLSEDGERHASLSPGRMPTAFDLVDLDGDASKEVVTVHPPSGLENCALAAYSTKDGSLLWDTELAACGAVWLDVTSPEGESPLISVTGFKVGHHSFRALVGGDGKVKWIHHSTSLPSWTIVTREGAAFGGAGEDGRGFVAFHAAETGETLWETTLPYWRDPSDPLEGREAFTHFATAIGDIDEDGYEEFALTTQAGEVYLLDGATGEILWRQWIREDGSTSAGGGGAIAWVPESETTPGYLVATERENRAIPTAVSIFAVDGSRKASFVAKGGVAALSLRESADGEWRVALAERFGATVLGVLAQDEEE